MRSLRPDFIGTRDDNWLFKTASSFQNFYKKRFTNINSKKTMKKISLFLTILLSIGFLQAQDKSTITFTFDHLALSVKDIDRSAEFYKNVLNLNEIINRTEIPGIRWFSFGEGKELHLISIISEEVMLNKAVHLALTTPNFDEFVKVLEKLNIQYSDWPGTPNTVNMRTDGIKQIYFQDPDGYWIEVNNVAQMK